LIDLPLGRLDPARGWWMKVEASGAPAQTRWRLLGRGEWQGAKIAWLALSPLTGRTHQLRVHCTAMGWPILGDAIYGNAARIGGPPLHLHAQRIEIPLIRTKPPIIVEAPAPPHMRAALDSCSL
jgi:tRNA pseudouridine32 synthase/23S rRNA pseudouridine746 synthase